VVDFAAVVRVLEPFVEAFMTMAALQNAREMMTKPEFSADAEEVATQIPWPVKACRNINLCLGPCPSVKSELFHIFRDVEFQL
jgi:hypothetical protein